MKKLILLFLVIALNLQADFKVKLRDGKFQDSTYSYDIIEQFTYYKSAIPIKQYTKEYSISIKDKNELKDGKIKEWKFDKVNYRSIAGDESQFYDEAVHQLLDQISLIYRVDSSGMFEDYLNYNAIKLAMSENTLYFGREYNDTSKPTKKEYISNIEKRLSSRFAIESQYHGLLEIYHAPYGLLFDKDSIVHRVTESYLPFLSIPFESELTFEILNMDKEKKLCYIEISQNLDDKSIKNIIFEHYNSLENTKEKIESIQDFERIEISEKAKYVINYQTGLINSIAHKREVYEGENYQITNTVFKLRE